MTHAAKKSAHRLYDAPIDDAERNAAWSRDAARLREEARFICGVLRLPRLCAKAACRRADLCRGHPRACLDQRGEAAPAEAREFAELLLDAVATGVSMETLEESYPDSALAWRCWIAALDARR